MVAAMRLFLLIVLTTTVTARAELLDGVAAIVNDKVITYSDVRELVQPVIAQLRRNFSGPELLTKVKATQLDALNNLIERNLILAEFKDKGYSFPDSVIDEQMNDILANDFGGDRAAFIKTLQSENQTLAKYREMLRDRIIVQAMRNRKTQNEIVVSPYKIEEYYKTHRDDFKEEDQIKLRMILIKKSPAAATPVAPTNSVDTVTTNAAETAAAPLENPRRKMAEEILAKLDAGDSFESLAKVYSEGKEGQKGGDWGWIKRAEFRKELSDPAFALKAGEHTRIVETVDGFYILQVDDVKVEYYRPLTEVRDIIEKELLQEQRAKMQQAWVKQLRAKAYIRMF
ncbi:MAG: peptidylprolyl isomerase [Verrucomicrobiota bacterium]